MFIAQAKRKENIAEYILYIWQLEDLLRALQFSPEAIYSQLVEPLKCDPSEKQQAFFWYMEMVDLLRSENKETFGHLNHTLRLIEQLDQLHRQLLELPGRNTYQDLYAPLAEDIPALKTKLQKNDISDVELFFRVLYAVFLYRIKADPDMTSYIRDAIQRISPLVAELASTFHLTEQGKLTLGKPEY